VSTDIVQSNTEENFITNIDISEITNNATIDIIENETETLSNFDATCNVLVITNEDDLMVSENTENFMCMLEKIEIPVTNEATKQFSEATQIADITEIPPIIFQDNINQESSAMILNSTNQETFSDK